MLRLVLLLSGSFFATAAFSATPCAESIADLRTLLADPVFSLKWRETGMDDGKPLVLTILERDGVLVVSFEKTDEGLWVEGASVVCRDGDAYDIRFVAGKVRTGRAANLMVQYTVLNGGQFTLRKTGTEKLEIGAGAWTGTFALERK